MKTIRHRLHNSRKGTLNTICLSPIFTKSFFHQSSVSKQHHAPVQFKSLFIEKGMIKTACSVLWQTCGPFKVLIGQISSSCIYLLEDVLTLPVFRPQNAPESVLNRVSLSLSSRVLKFICLMRTCVFSTIVSGIQAKGAFYLCPDESCFVSGPGAFPGTSLPLYIRLLLLITQGVWAEQPLSQIPQVVHSKGQLQTCNTCVLQILSHMHIRIKPSLLGFLLGGFAKVSQSLPVGSIESYKFLPR